MRFSGALQRDPRLINGFGNWVSTGSVVFPRVSSLVCGVTWKPAVGFFLRAAVLEPVPHESLRSSHSLVLRV